MNELVSIRQGNVITNSIIIASGTGIAHRYVKEQIRKYETQILQLGVLVGYATETTLANLPVYTMPSTSAGGRPEEYYELNEPQASFVLTLLKNTSVVVAFKLELVKQFYQTRMLLLSGKPINPPVDFLERCGVIPPALPEPSDKEVAIHFLKVLQDALVSGEYYLLYKHCRKPEPQAGILLGVFDDTEITLISSRTYNLYKQRTNYDIKIQRLWEKLINSGLVSTRTASDRNRLVRGNACCVIRVQIQVATAISGLNKPLMTG